jgi:DNA-binding beta-propeller fold protein YncE
VREILPGQPTEEVVEPEEAPAIAAAPAPDLSPFANLREPRGAAVDRQGRLWIADTGHNRLRLFDAAGGTLGGWGGRNDSPYGFREPGAVAIDGERLYVADTWNGRVLAYALADGKHLVTVDGLFGPRGIAAAKGRVVVSDTGNHRVSVFDADLKPLATSGKKGTGPQEMDSPVGIAAGPGGEFYVADVINRRLQVLDAKGAILRAIRFPGWASWCEPYLAADSDGTLYISDPSRSNVIVMSPDGHLIRTIAAADGGETFSRPTGVAIDRERRALFIVDAVKNTVFKIALPPAPSKATAKPSRRTAGSVVPDRLKLGLSFARRQGPSDVIQPTPPISPVDFAARGAR